MVVLKQESLEQKILEGERISTTEALALYRRPLAELGALADARRNLAKEKSYDGRGREIVTYIVDRNINYTNVCNVYCKFCAFYRTEKDDDSYVITFDEMDKKIEETIALGGTQMLMQGGHHPKLTKQWYLDLLSHIKTKFPQINIHGFSPSEIFAFSEFFNEPVEQVLKDFMAAGLGSLPGGGGEILVDRVRNRIAPLKANSAEWMNVMDVAHRLGLASSITMMFGHVETVEDRIEHLEFVRQQQDKSLERLALVGRAVLSAPGRDRNDNAVAAGDARRGEDTAPYHIGQAAAFANALETETLSGGAFTAFICWTFQPDNAVLKAPTVGAHEYLRTQALGRIYLDNIPSVQSSWVTQGLDIGQVALKYGANDLGSIMIEENVVSAAGTTFRMGVADMQRLITDLGYEAHQRDNWYRLIS